MAKNSRSASLAQVKKSLSVLRKKGLYTPKDVRAAPTDYAKRIARQYRDVAAGKAFVLKADAKTIAKLKSEDVYRTRKGRVIVSKDSFTQSARINKRTGEVVKYKTVKGQKWRFTPANAKSIDELPKLKKGQTYVLPFQEGKEGIRFQTRADLQEFIALLDDYEKRQKNAYRNPLKYVQIGTLI